MKRQWKIKNLITTAFAMMSAIITIIFLIFIANWQIKIQQESLYDDLNQLSDTVIYNITSELNKMNQASLSILYSNTIRDNFQLYSDFQNGFLNNKNDNSIYNASQTLKDMALTILTNEGSFSKIVLYDPNNGAYTIGPNTGYNDITIKDKHWYSQVVDSSDHIITYPYEDPEFSAEFTYKLDRKYVSLVRPYYSDFNTISGYVEIVQNYDVIFDVINSISYNPIYNIIILDKDNNSVNNGMLPMESYDELVNYARSSPLKNGTVEYKTDTNTIEISHNRSFEQYGYQCLITVDKSKLFQPINKYIINFLILSLIIIMGVLLLSLFISRVLTTPIYDLYNAIKNADITDEDAFDSITVETNILELNALWIASVTSHTRLRHFMNELIMVEQREVQAKMIALQSQMNPHFLYNSLSVLTSIIEENRNDEAIAFCEKLSTMLRYVSSTKEPLINLEDELEHTHTYLESMTYRYGADLSFAFEVPDSMLQIQVPKLTVQALVENAVKYATLKHAPWHIGIKAYSRDDYWHIEVSDNGYGFKADTIENLLEKVKTIKNGQLIPHLSLDGMGLLNLLYRIKLHSKSDPSLSINNLPDKGCNITIGGRISYEKNTSD